MLRTMRESDLRLVDAVRVWTDQHVRLMLLHFGGDLFLAYAVCQLTYLRSVRGTCLYSSLRNR